MNIPIRQTELNRIGFTGDFNALRYYDRKNVAALALNAAGRKQEAFLLEINNPNAIAGITYILDTPLRPTRPGVVLL